MMVTINFYSESESAVLANHVYTYKDFDSGISLLSMYLHINTLTAENKDNKAEQRYT